MANMMVTPRDSFSPSESIIEMADHRGHHGHHDHHDHHDELPESGGRVKPSTAMLEMRRHGMMRLVK